MPVSVANDQAVLLSVLVVSRTPHLLAGMLLSLNHAYAGSSVDLEVLCSWNGDDVNSQPFLAASRYQLHLIVQRPYNFSRNVNCIAALARGRFLLLLNDDVLLDPLTINAALELYENTPRAGIIGSVLRRRDGEIAHMGIAFNQDGHPYHVMEGLRNVRVDWLQSSYRVPAVTGACLLILRFDYELLGLDPSFDVYGEDVDLCLRLRRQLFKDVWCCIGLKGIHEASTTRKIVGTDNPNAKDSGKIIDEYKSFMECCQKSELLLELLLSQIEVSVLREATFSLQSLVLSQRLFPNIPLSPAITDTFVDADDAQEGLIGGPFQITTQLRHERLEEIHDIVIQATTDISEMRLLALQIYYVLTQPQLAIPDPPSSLLDIFYDHWTILANK